MTNLIARRSGSDFNLFADGVQFGRLANCETAYIFICDDERLDQSVQLRWQPDFSFREMLAAVRAGYEAWVDDLRGDVEADWATERAALQALEYCPHAQADLDPYNAVAPY